MRMLLLTTAAISAVLGATTGNAAMARPSETTDPQADQAMAGTPGMPGMSGTILTIVAEGSATRTPDIATIRAGVVTQGATATDALRENSARMNAVMAALRRSGVAERDIRTATVSLQPQYRYQDNQPPVLTGYQAVNTVSVRFRDIARSGAILDTLVTQGANSIDGPALSIDDPSAAMDEARTDAMRRARARAQLYADAAGLHVGRILSISEGADTSQPGPIVVRAMARAESDSVPISAGEQDVTTNVTVRFLLN